MYIYIISPILENVPFDELSYFSKYAFEVGEIVEINFNNKKINGIIIDKKDLTKGSNKSEIRKATFLLKKIDNGKTFGKLENNVFKKINDFVKENLVSFGEVFYVINNIFSENKKDKTKEEVFNTFYIYPNELSYKKAKANRNKNEIQNIYKISEFIKNIHKTNLNSSKIYLHDFSFINYFSYQKPFINYFKLLILILEILNINCEIILVNNFFGVCEEYFIKSYENKEGKFGKAKFSLKILNTNSDNKIQTKKYLIKDKLINNQNKNNIFSDKFLQEIENAIKKNERSFIFVLSHGYADRIYCEVCNYAVKCKKCKKEISLIQEDEEKFLKCKNCNYKEFLNINKNLRCENCGSYNLKDFGVGIQKVFNFLKRITEKIKMIDEADKKISQGKIIKEVQNFNDKILIGSIKVLKVLENNFDNVFILSLGPLPKSNNFFFDEKILEILSVAEGKTKKIFIQQNSEDELIWDRYKNIDKYYTEEIEIRKISKLPPFSKILNISLDYKNKKILDKLSFKNRIENMYYMNKRIHFYLNIYNENELESIYKELQNYKPILDYKISNIIEAVNFWKK